MSEPLVRWAVLAALGARRTPMRVDEIARIVADAGLDATDLDSWLARALAASEIEPVGDGFVLASRGAASLLDVYGEIATALAEPGFETCPSVPWLTTVQTEWIEAVSLNYAVDPAALASLLPAPIEPEIWKGSAWVQVLVSSLRDMRPQGLGALFGVSFYQASYRAAVRWPRKDGGWWRAGYFVRSETNHPVMQAVGNRLTEFRFHEFGLADMALVRDGSDLTVAIDSHAPGGKLVAVLDTTHRTRPSDSVWTGLDELHEPLIECYDALGVDRANGWLYVLTIDREPWNATFAETKELYCEALMSGPLAAGARFDSALHIERCAYKWKPLRREPLPR